MDKPLRILYAAGPGNVIGTYRHWKEGRDDPTQIAMTYSGQFYDVCRELGAEAYVIAGCPIPGKLRDGNIRIEHRSVPFENSGGLLYHIGQIYYGFRLLISALRFGANVAIICAGTHWFMLWLLTLFGIKVIPSLHCVLWRKYNWKPTFFQRIVHYLNGGFLARGCEMIITVSEEISQQVQEITGGKHRAIHQFIPQYRSSSFDQIRPADHARRPFRVLFVGRIERNKGVFDLLEMARRLAAKGYTDIEFDLCGAGSAEAELRKEIDAAGLASQFRCHGHCDQETMSEMYSLSHVVIVPTTSDFSEGFNKVVAEGVLAGRPIVTSSVCPALAYVRGAVLEVPPDNVDAYVEAILRLYQDAELYNSKRDACGAARSQFYDMSRGWGALVKNALADLSARNSAPPGWFARTVGRFLS